MPGDNRDSIAGQVGGRLEVELRQQVRTAYKGHKHQNAAAPILRLYHEKKVMKSLGIMTKLDDLDSWEITAFCIIEDEIAKLNELERKKNASRRNH